MLPRGPFSPRTGSVGKAGAYRSAARAHPRSQGIATALEVPSGGGMDPGFRQESGGKFADCIFKRDFFTIDDAARLTAAGGPTRAAADHLQPSRRRQAA